MAEITPMPSPHAEAAKALLDKIRALRADIPRITTVGLGDDRQLNGQNGVPDSFIESASVAIQVSPRLEQVAGADASTLRDAFGFALAYEAVVQELRALARVMAHTIRSQRAEAAASARDVYAIARRLSGQRDGAELVPYVDDMRRKLNARRTRRTTSEPGPATPLSTAPSVTA